MVVALINIIEYFPVSISDLEYGTEFEFLLEGTGWSYWKKARVDTDNMGIFNFDDINWARVKYLNGEDIRDLGGTLIFQEISHGKIEYFFKFEFANGVILAVSYDYNRKYLTITENKPKIEALFDGYITHKQQLYQELYKLKKGRYHSNKGITVRDVLKYGEIKFTM